MKYYICISYGRIAHLTKDSLQYHIEGLATKSANKGATIFCIGKDKLSIINIGPIFTSDETGVPVARITREDILNEARWVGNNAEFVVVATSKEDFDIADQIKPASIDWVKKSLTDNFEREQYLYLSFEANPHNSLHPQIATSLKDHGTQINPEYTLLQHPQASIFENTDALVVSILPEDKQLPRITKLLFDAKNWLPVTPKELSTDFLSEIKNQFQHGKSCWHEINLSLYNLLKANVKTDFDRQNLIDSCNKLAHFIETIACINNHPDKYLAEAEARTLYVNNFIVFLNPPYKTDGDQKFCQALQNKLKTPNITPNDIDTFLRNNKGRLSFTFTIKLAVFKADLDENYKRRNNCIKYQLHLEKLIEHARLLTQEANIYLNYDDQKLGENECLEIALTTLKVALNDCVVATCANHPRLLTLYSKAGHCLYRMNKFDEAISYYQQEMNLLLTYHSKKFKALAANYFNQGMCFLMLTKTEHAIPLLKKALEQRLKNPRDKELWEQNLNPRTRREKKNLEELNKIRVALDDCKANGKLPSQQGLRPS